jgi:anti-sigma regulatory factor (Ser/Thr protein kinase)
VEVAVTATSLMLITHDHLASATFPGQAGAVHDVRRFIDGQLSPLGFDDDTIANVLLAASELATNAVQYSRSRGGEFTVRLGCDPDRIRVAVVDDGPLPTPPVDLARCGGMGLGIVAKVTTAHGASTGAAGARTSWFVIDTPERA